MENYLDIFKSIPKCELCGNPIEGDGYLTCCKRKVRVVDNPEEREKYLKIVLEKYNE
jgi:hypothetical protein